MLTVVTMSNLFLILVGMTFCHPSLNMNLMKWIECLQEFLVGARVSRYLTVFNR